MNPQVNPPARQRTAELPHRNLISRLRARSLIVPVMLAVLALGAPVAMADPLGQFTEFAAGLNPGSSPGYEDSESIAAGPDGNLWFTDEGTTPAIGRITPFGQITEFSAGLNPYAIPVEIAAGPDGNLWFTDQGTTPAIGRITPFGQITEFTDPQNPNFSPEGGITAGPDGNVWFTDYGDNRAIGQITPSGQITEFPTGLNTLVSPAAFVDPDGITAGPDGDLWFTDDAGAIGRIGSGAAPALGTPASVTGAGAAGSAETCQAQWPDWVGYGPSTALYPFDGYTWLLDGTPITGQTAQTYTPTAGDVGHQLACRLTGTYPLPYSVTATTATSAAITVKPAPPPTAGQPPAPSQLPTPALSALDITPRMFTLTGRRVGGRCQPPSRSNRRERPCTRPIALRVRFTLSVGATVTFAIERAVPGRLTRGRCTTPTRSDSRHRPCTRQLTLPGTTVINAGAGADAFTFHGVIGGRALAPGRYRLLATPSAGHSSHRRQTTFQIVR